MKSSELELLRGGAEGNIEVWLVVEQASEGGIL